MDDRFIRCPECRGRLLADAVNCAKCGWNKDDKRVTMDSLGRATRCTCGELASVYAGAIGRCSACDAKARFAGAADGPGYAQWRLKIEQMRGKNA